MRRIDHSAVAVAERRGAAARTFHACDAIRDLTARLDAIEGDDPVLALEAARPLAQNTAWFETQVRDWLANMQSDSNFMSPLGAANVATDGLQGRSAAIVYSHPKLLITMLTFSAPNCRRMMAGMPPQYLSFSGQQELSVVLGGGSMEVQTWSCPPITEHMDLRGKLTVTPGGLHRLDHSTGPVQRDNRCETYTIESVEKTTTLLRFSSVGRIPSFVVRCDREFNIVEVAPVHRRDARLLMYAAVLRALSQSNRGLGLKSQLSNESFFVRAQFIREFVSLEGVSSLDILRSQRSVESNPSVISLLDRTIRFLEERQEHPSGH